MISNRIIVPLRLSLIDCYNLGEIVRIDNGFWFQWEKNATGKANRGMEIKLHTS